MSELRVPCQVFSRVVGYISPTKYWNKGKLQEWKERQEYRTPTRKELNGDLRRDIH